MVQSINKKKRPKYLFSPRLEYPSKTVRDTMHMNVDTNSLDIIPCNAHNLINLIHQNEAVPSSKIHTEEDKLLQYQVGHFGTNSHKRKEV
jgi:hypothetical protein